jgi:hypothetical protein
MFAITDPKQARALADLNNVKYLLFFVRDELTVSQAARAWKLKLEDAYYRVVSLERLGLINVVRVSKRAGRDTKHYRAVATDFFVPLDIVPEMALDVFLGTVNQYYYEVMYREQARAIHHFLAQYSVGHWGVRIALDGDGQADMHLADRFGHQPSTEDPRMPLIASAWPQFELNFEDAQSFRRELIELMDRYSKKRGARKYLVHFALTPLEK